MGRQQGKSRPRSFAGKRTKRGDHHQCHSGVRDSAQVQKVRNEKIEIAFDTGEVYKHFKKSALQGCVPGKCSAEMTALGTESAETASWRNSRGSGRAGWRGGQWGCGLWAVPLTGPRGAGRRPVSSGPRSGQPRAGSAPTDAFGWRRELRPRKAE